MRRPRSIRSQLLLALMLMTLLTLTLVTLLSADMDLKLFRDQMPRDLRVFAAVVGENCVSSLVFDSPESAELNMSTLADEYQIRSATLYDAWDRPFAGWQRSPPEPRSNRVALVEIAHPVRFDDRPIGRLVLVAGLHELERQTRTYA